MGNKQKPPRTKPSRKRPKTKTPGQKIPRTIERICTEGFCSGF